MNCGRLRLKCDGTRAETRFRLSAKRTIPFKSSRGGQFSRLLVAEVCASAVVMLDTPCSEIVWRVLDTHSIRQSPLQFPSRASPCAITFQLDSTYQAILPYDRRTDTGLVSWMQTEKYGIISQLWESLRKKTLPGRVAIGVLLFVSRKWVRHVDG
jgi:hypothetical protein